jgi:HAD superfamily hydrolase (TIGR01549 family)
MKKIEAIIFDMDGTLYSFDQRKESHFISSKFGQTIHDNCVTFLKNEFSLNKEGALQFYQELNERYHGELSLGLERDYDIDRSRYFAETWNLEASEFIEANEELVKMLSLLTVKTGVLSAAPKIWVDRVLNFLTIRQFFGKAIFTGDPDIRKPNHQAFQQLADFWKIAPEKIVSIGDQETSDILPAKKIGMSTVRIGREIDSTADFLAEDAIQAIAILKKEGLL